MTIEKCLEKLGYPKEWADKHKDLIQRIQGKCPNLNEHEQNAYIATTIASEEGWPAISELSEVIQEAFDVDEEPIELDLEDDFSGDDIG